MKQQLTSEKKIENDLVQKLSDLKYTYRKDIRDRASLEANFRRKFELLNGVQLTDREFLSLMDQIITDNVFTAARTLRERNTFQRDDDSYLHFTLVNINDWCKNSYEVIRQLRINTHSSHQRYDVILLINGIPVVQIELKRGAASPRNAMQQIIDYKNEQDNGYSRTLLCFMQIFIVSNRHETWYFANNNNNHFSFNADEKFLPLYQYADANNRKIVHLDDFAETFLSRCTLGEIISRYMVLVASEQRLIMMRPYQIYAVKNIVECIHHNSGNGYIWHTTGSGKTLTSFKASTLLRDNPDIEKCLFVVDRKDLDRQTREEFNRFQEGCVEENTNTEALVQRLVSDDYANKVIVTTIQKLGLALDETNRNNYKKQLEPLRNKRIAIIFDECHRSQFGENHSAIREFFPKAQLFGFTGTPIFEKNAIYYQVEGTEASYKTTDDVFHRELHAYTITHAIEDRNVLRFQVEYYKPDENKKIKAGESLTKRAIAEAILGKHDIATANRKFNAILATNSINDAIQYYELFKTIQAAKVEENNDFRPLNIACVFSPPAEGNKDVKQIQEDLPQEREDNKDAPNEKKAALQTIIADYNARFGTNHRLNEFDLYYQDVQTRIKDQQYPSTVLPREKKIDVIIVVDMLLTGFDSKYLNTLYVDKNLRYHGLIQAFSRTNRILNDSKPYGNILDFRQQQDAVNDAIALFSGEKIEQPNDIWLVDPAPVVIDKLQTSFHELSTFMQSQGLECVPKEVVNLKGDAAKATFINLFKDVQRIKTQLDQYTSLTPDNIETIEKIIPAEQMQGFRNSYLETARQLKRPTAISDEELKEEPVQLDFEFVLFASDLIDYDFIMTLIAQFTSQKPGKQKMTREEIIGLIQADAKFIDERDDIAEYIYTLKAGKPLSEQDIRQGYENFKNEKHTRELAGIAAKHGLDSTALQAFVDRIIQRTVFDREQLSQLLAPLALGWKARSRKGEELMREVVPLLRKLAHGRNISGLRVYEL